ncbi:hypothetical protein [Hydrogenobacter thermophilus]|uniref:hypothetical protein n=1 Tax=Hydrogenobacter thermophilus TaxID=940 RepID=UPI0030FACE5E
MKYSICTKTLNFLYLLPCIPDEKSKAYSIFFQLRKPIKKEFVVLSVRFWQKGYVLQKLFFKRSYFYTHLWVYISQVFYCHRQVIAQAKANVQQLYLAFYFGPFKYRRWFHEL